jgi:hypothetical protein
MSTPTSGLPEQLVGQVLHEDDHNQRVMLTQSLNNESVSHFQHAQEINRPSSAPPSVPVHDEDDVCDEI